MYYYGTHKTRSWFEGWYFKCQTRDGNSIALIPAIHIDGTGAKTASIQVITQGRSWCVNYPGKAFSAQTELFRVQIGENIFSELGMELRIHENGIDLVGKLVFDPFHRLKYPIMGPFRLIPSMECAHSVISMNHALKGELMLNGDRLDFNGGIGYIESDRGRSFPSAYLWAQDVWEDSGFMLAIGKIPLGGLNFTGCICGILLDGREYRIATYLGARVIHWSDSHAQIQQGRYRLEVEVMSRKSNPLMAPCTGKMIRTVHESICSVLRLRFARGEQILLDRLTGSAGFEFDDQQ